MRHTSVILAVVLPAALLSGCMSAEDKRLEGIAFSGGNAMAANSALQIIDPWPAGVQDTDLKVPADRGGVPAQTASGDGGTTTTAQSQTQ